MKVLKLVEKIFTGIVIAIVLLIIVSIVPIPGNYKIYIVESGSMEPAIHTGSVVVVKSADNYLPGDIITFSEGKKGKTTTHRIKDVEVVVGKSYFITKGDANNSEDPSKVPSSRVIGKVYASVPYFGYLLAYAKQPIGFILLVLLPCAMIIFDEAQKIWQELIKQREQKKGDLSLENSTKNE